MTNKLTFAMKLESLRKFKKLNQSQLADLVGVSRAAISLYESGKNSPSYKVLKKLSEALDTDIAVLMDDAATAEMPKAPFDAHAIGPLADMPHVDLPAPSFKVLASFAEMGGITPEALSHCDTLRVYLRPYELPEKYEGAMVIEIWGDSMEPELHSGERMIAWQVPESKWETLHNAACVVAYDDTVTIKAIIENDLFVHDRLTLRAANKEAGYFVVSRDTIHSIWEVREYYDRPKYSLSFNRR